MVALGASPGNLADDREKLRSSDVDSIAMTSLLRSSDVLRADDLRFHRRLPHAAAPQRIASEIKKAAMSKPSRLQFFQKQQLYFTGSLFAPA